MDYRKINLDKLDSISKQKMMSCYDSTKQMGGHTVKVKRVDGERGLSAQMPEYKTVGSAGADLRAAESVTINPRSVGLVRTGLIFECPNNRWEVQIRSRSGLALKNSVFVLNSPGTIDSDYRGEVGIILFNAGSEPFNVSVGDRVAQAVISKLQAIVFEETDTVSNTERDAGGFGSTGIK